MTRSSLVLSITGVLLLAVGGLLFWNRTGDDSSMQVHGPALGSQAHDSKQEPPAAKPERNTPSPRPKEAEGRRDLEKIHEWISDESITPEMASVKLWEMASDSSRPEIARNEALVNALNLADDETYASKVIPLLGRKGLFTDEMAEKILDDLYNRPTAIKLAGTLALFQNSSGELQTHVRELLAFEVTEPGSDEVSDAELIRLANEKMKSPEDP